MSALTAIVLAKPCDRQQGTAGLGQEVWILELFRRLREQTGAALLIITHDENVAAASDRSLQMTDGVINDV